MPTMTEPLRYDYLSLMALVMKLMLTLFNVKGEA